MVRNVKVEEQCCCQFLTKAHYILISYFKTMNLISVKNICFHPSTQQKKLGHTGKQTHVTMMLIFDFLICVVFEWANDALKIKYNVYQWDLYQLFTIFNRLRLRDKFFSTDFVSDILLLVLVRPTSLKYDKSTLEVLCKGLSSLEIDKSRFEYTADGPKKPL